MRFISRFVLAASFVFAAGSAMAATIDFTGATGSLTASGDDDSVVYSGNAAFGDVTVSADRHNSDLTYGAGNGLGIDCRGGGLSCILDSRNQVDTGEILSISFEEQLFVTSVDIRNLFGTNIGSGHFSINIAEGGSVVGTNFEIGFDSDDAGSNGALNLVVNRWATSISFVPNGGFFDAFSVAGISIDELASPLPTPSTNPIPEPSSILLMIAGGAFILTQLRRKV